MAEEILNSEELPSQPFVRQINQTDPSSIRSTARWKGWISPTLIFLLIASTVYLWVRLDLLQKDLNAASIRIASLEIGLETAESNITVINGRIGSVNSDLSNLASYIDSVAAVANNADFYAHSHPYSDIRLKTNILPITSALDKILQLKGITYRWTPEAQSTLELDSSAEIGLIAQDVEEIFPELVISDTEGYKHVDYARLTPILIEAIREQQYEILQLQQRLNASSK